MKDQFNENYFEARYLHQCIEIKNNTHLCACVIFVSVLLYVYGALILTSMQDDVYKCMIK